MSIAAVLAADPLLALLLQLAMIGSLTAGCFVLLSRRSRAPALRHALAKAGLWVLLLLPFTVALAHGSGAGVALLPAATATARPQLADSAPGHSREAEAAPSAAQSAPPQRGQAQGPPIALPEPPAASLPASRYLLLMWGALSLALLLRELHRWLRLCATIAAASPLDDAQLADRIADLASSLGVRRTPRLVALAALPCPATFGVLRPTLLMPRPWPTDHDTAATTAILRHELAHLALGHHREGALQLLARCLFAWLPWAHALCRELGKAQEQLADNVAIAGAGNPTAYARTLLDLAERASRLPPPAPLLLSSLGNHELLDRITRLLSGDLDMNQRPSRRGRFAATATLLLAAAAPFPLRLLPAQVPPPPPGGTAQQSTQPATTIETPGPNSGAHFLPLAENTSWTWQVTRRDGDQASERNETSRVWGMVPAVDGAMVAQVQTTRGDFISWDYLAARNDGVFTYRNAYLGGLRGVTRIDERLLPAPVGGTTQWEWDQQLSYQTMGDAPAPDPAAMRVHHLAKLLAMDEAVTVPAGSYKAVHVRIAATGAQVYTRDLWFARGVGIVKDEHTSADTHQVRELTAFTPGRNVAFAAEAALRAFCQATPPFADAAVEWVPVGGEACYLRGRFAILRTGDTSTCAHVTGAGVVTFAPDDKAYWTTQLAALIDDRTPANAGQQRSRPGDDLQLTYLAGLAARLQALRQGCSGLKSGGSQTEQQLGAQPSTTCTVSVHARSANHDPVLVRACMQVDGGAVTGMTLETRPDEGKGR